MRCRRCDYPLWSIADRTCPECGQAFRPSEYEFVPDTVKFCCPDCEQPYYGTSSRGHLIPTEFDCVQCGRALTMDQMVLTPAAGVPEERTVAERMPWTERSRVGFFSALLKTTVLAHFNPLKLTRSLPADSKLGDSAWFSLITCGGAYLVGMLPFALLLLIGGGGVGAGLIRLMTMAGSIVIGLAVFVLIWGAVAHVLLKLTGGSAFGIGRTFEVLLYSSGTNAMVAIPCLGPFLLSYITSLWWPVSAILMLKEGQRVHGGRATLAILALPLLLLVGSVAVYIVFLMIVLRGLQAGQNTVPFATEQLAAISQVIDARVEETGVYPLHGFELFTAGGMTGDQMIGPGSELAPSDVLLSSIDSEINLITFELLTAEEQEDWIVDVAEAFPADVVAHRVGDFVFTMHGVTPPTDPGLWTVIFAPEYGTSSPFNVGDDTVMVLQADGTVVNVSDDVGGALQAQNQLRLSLGLGQLPGPRSISPYGPTSPATFGAPSATPVPETVPETVPEMGDEASDPAPVGG